MKKWVGTLATAIACLFVGGPAAEPASDALFSGPIQATFLVTLPEPRAWLTLEAGTADPKAPAVSLRLMRSSDNGLTLDCGADGKPMDAMFECAKLYTKRGQPCSSTKYGWRFEATRNLWSPRDRAEIGSSYQHLTPFDRKTFVVKLVVLADERQIWIDDRLVAWARMPAPAAGVRFAAGVRPGTSIAGMTVEKPWLTGRFTALTLGDLYAQPTPGSPGTPGIESELKVPFRVPPAGARPIDLSESLYRYRLTHGTGPNAPYVNASRSWPGGLAVDPAEATLRVPFKPYQNVWVLAWVDAALPNAVPKGTLRFYKQESGYPAMTDFEVTPQSIEKGLARKLPLSTPEGRPLYLVKVPVDTNGFYGLSDQRSGVIDLQITKPVALGRSYPDPIYFGHHPAGPASSLKVVGITLEEAPFDYDVQPRAFAHTFERTGPILYDVPVTNTSDAPIEAVVTLSTQSYDASERRHGTGRVVVQPGRTERASIDLSAIQTLGWHSLDIAVEAGGARRANTLSLVILPPNTRTYGLDPKEIRFGSWNLLGHYTPVGPDKQANERILALYRRLGLRYCADHASFFDIERFPAHDMLPTGPHTIVALYHRHRENDPAAIEKMLADEDKNIAAAARLWKHVSYYYGGEWYYDHVFPYGPNPRYTGRGPYTFSDAVEKNILRQKKIFTDIGSYLRERYPEARLTLQWGGANLTVGFMEYGFPKELVDAYGIDAPMFELTPELPTGTGTINTLWNLRAEARRMGWPDLPIGWCEGPFLNTNPGALTLREQEENYVRYFMHGLAYGIDRFEAGVVPFDAGNYYGAEHYGAGVYERIPLVCPKPAVAAISTATAKLCNAEVVGPVETGVLTTYAMAFKNAAGRPMYCLWRAAGSVQASLAVGDGTPTLTDAMGNTRPVPVTNGTASITLSTSPVWFEGAAITRFAFAEPRYDERPAATAVALTSFNGRLWAFDGSPQRGYETNHFGTSRTADEGLAATFAAAGTDDDRSDLATVTLAPQPAGDRPLAIRYGSLVPRRRISIPGKAAALGMWIDGNSSWGRVIYQLTDAKGEVWTSIGTKNDWNCDDSHTWSFVKFEGRRYVRFPLPSNAPYDRARELESTWWKSEHGDGIVDLPLALERIIVEARNETLVLGQLKVVPDRSYTLSGLVAEYADPADAGEEAVRRNSVTMPPADWTGPSDNPIARLARDGVQPAPTIDAFIEPVQFNDGRRMIIHFKESPAAAYTLYVSTFADGRGAEVLDAAVKDGKTVVGFQPGLPVYLFLTQTGADKRESKPSAAYRLVTEDKFAEK